ncbi:MAG TPA: AI-2E family transporter [Chryseolinea sp.]
MNNKSEPLTRQIIEIIIQLGALAFIVGWCILILAPFLTPIVWGVIIAITIYPMFIKLSAKLGDRRKMSAIILTLLLLAIVLAPAILLSGSLIDGARFLKNAIQEGDSLIPPPGDRVASWPAFAKPLVDAWQLASDNLQSMVITYKDQVTAAAAAILGAIAKTSIGILEFVLSIIIAGVLLIYADEGGGTLRRIFVKVAGDRGEEMATLSEVTIRNVVKGILGVAVIQTLLAGIGFAVAGVPAAGLWTFFCLIFAIVQVGVGPIMIPIMIWLFSTADTTTAVIFLIYGIFVLISDNFLKPFLLGRGAPVPMLVVFLGAIGGLIVKGFIGLFLGAVILSLGYKLFLMWIADREAKSHEKAEQT